MSPRSRPGWGIAVLVAALFFLRLDFWNWHSPALVAGLPIGLLHHVLFCVLMTVVLLRLVPTRRTEHDGDPERTEDAR